ncbi:hypothetical protein MMC13_008284 [Lambiella insularis]|nr:hypothetical protein [Lambiella insularis]
MPGFTAAHVTQYTHPELLRTPQSRSPSETGHRPQSFKPGTFLWLPSKDKLEGRFLISGIGDGCFNHPVIILSADVASTKATILILTSFNGLDLATKFPRNKRLRGSHLPITPSAVHPDNMILLSLKCGAHLRKSSYIKMDTRYSINTSLLDPYDRCGGIYQLDQASHQALVDFTVINPPRTVVSYSYDISPDPFVNDAVSGTWLDHMDNGHTDYSYYSNDHPVAAPRSLLQAPSQARIPPLSSQHLYSSERTHIYNVPSRNGYSTIPHYDHVPYTSMQKPEAEPDPSIIDFVIKTLLVGAIGYGGYRLVKSALGY